MRSAIEVGHVADASDGQVLDRARRRLADGGGDPARPALADHDAGGAGGLGAPADRAEVARVLDLVERDDERVLGLEQRLGVRVRIGVDLGDDALVVGGAGEPGQLAPASVSSARPDRAGRGAGRAPPRATGLRP